jgi:hypothetical protein
VLEVLSTRENVTVYIAPLAGAPGSETYGKFKKVGRTPLVIQLPPGSYRVEAEGVDISNGGTDIAMHGAPRQLTVSPGKEGMGLVGSLFLGLGITGILGATAIIASGTSAPSALDKPAVLIPAYAAGGVLTGAGIGFLVASSTDVEPTPAPRPQPISGFALSLSGRF